MGRTKLILVLGALLAATGAYYARDTLAPVLEGAWPAAKRAGHREPRDNRVPVLTAPVTTADVPVYVTGVGTVRPANTVVVRAQVTGKIREIAFTEGQDVRKGELIAQLDDALYRAQRDQAIARKMQDEALLSHAQDELARVEKLADNATGTRQQVDSQRSLVAQYSAQVQSDQAAIEAAEAQLAYTTITAPMDGRTGIRAVDVGNIVGSGDTNGIVTLSQIRPIAVLFSIPQQQLSRVASANARGVLKVEALAEDGRTVIAQGQLAVIDNQVDATTGTVRLKAEFPNDDLALWPGAFVNARLMVETLKAVATVPSAAVQRGPSGPFAYVVLPDHRVRLTPVVVASQDDRIAVIGSGLSQGDMVVTTGFARLQDGTEVRASPALGLDSQAPMDGAGVSARAGAPSAGAVR